MIQPCVADKDGVLRDCSALKGHRLEGKCSGLINKARMILKASDHLKRKIVSVSQGMDYGRTEHLQRCSGLTERDAQTLERQRDAQSLEREILTVSPPLSLNKVNVNMLLRNYR